MEDEGRLADYDGEIIADKYFGPDAGAARTIEELRLLADGKDVNEESLRTDTPLRRLKAFAIFVSTHSHILKSVPAEVVPLARNHANDGFVADRATSLAERLRRPWIARDPRPPWRSPSRLLTISAECYSVALAGDGRTALSSGPDGAWLWNTFSGSRLRSYPASNDRAIALSRDGSTALCVEGGSLQVWDIASGSSRVLHHAGDIRRAALSDNGLVAASSGPRQIFISDTASGRCLQTVECDAHDVALSGDGRFVISAGSDQTIRVWDVASGACLHTFHSDASCVAITGDGKIALSSGTESCVWDIESGARLGGLERRGRIERMALTADGRIALTIEPGRELFSGDRKWTIPNQVRIWDVASSKELRRAVASSVVDAAMSEDGRTVVTASMKGRPVTSSEGGVASELHVWNVVSTEDGEVNKDEISMVDVAFAPDYKTTLTASYNGLCITDLPSMECKYLNGHTDNINFVAVSPNGRMALSGACDYSLRVWDMETGACVRNLSCNTYVYGGAFAVDGRLAVSASDEVAVWDIATGECARAIRSPDELGDAISIALTPDDKTLLASYNALEMRLWSLSNSLGSLERQTSLEYEEPISERSLRLFKGHQEIIKCVAVTGDGRRAVSASLDQTLRVWDLTTGACIHKLTGHSGSVRSVALTADGRTAVSASEDGSVRIWDIVSGSCIGSYPFGRRAISLSAVRPDGQFAVVNAGGDIQYLRLRRVPQEPPFVTAVRLFTFALTKALAAIEDFSARDGFVSQQDFGAQEGFAAHEDAGAPRFAAGQLIGGEYERDITAGCLWCGQRLPAPTSALAAIHEIAKLASLAEDDSPCLKLPAEGWADPRLLSECPHCHQPLRFNPFIVDNRDRY